jgi:hypothetical protein
MLQKFYADTFLTLKSAPPWNFQKSALKFYTTVVYFAFGPTHSVSGGGLSLS